MKILQQRHAERSSPMRDISDLVAKINLLLAMQMMSDATLLRQAEELQRLLEDAARQADALKASQKETTQFRDALNSSREEAAKRRRAWDMEKEASAAVAVEAAAELGRLKGDLVRRDAAIASLKEAFADERRKAVAMKASTSWKLTAPLRYAMRFVPAVSGPIPEIAIQGRTRFGVDCLCRSS